MTAPVATSGVVGLVPTRPHVARQVQAVLAIASAAATGDPTAVEQLAVIDALLAIRATADISDREAEDGPASPRHTSAVATIAIHHRTERRAA